MYESAKNKWFKHFDFMVLDLIVIELSYLLACYIRIGGKGVWYFDIYRNMQILIVVFDFIIICTLPIHKNILKRKLHQELFESFKNITVLVLGMVLYLYLMKTAFYFSRAIFSMFWVIGFMMMFLMRVIYKKIVNYFLLKRGNMPRMLLVTEAQKMDSFMKCMKENSYNHFEIRAVWVIDCKTSEEQKQFLQGKDPLYKEIPVFFEFDSLYEYLKDHVIDEATLNVSDLKKTERLVQELMIIGMTVHINLSDAFEQLPNQIVEHIGKMAVLTSSIRIASPVQLLLKRLMDIAGSLVGLLITFIALIIFGPIIYVQSPGPIFYSQVRVGKNGRKFRIYKFRSMYLDADKRKEELMKQNKMDGFMFKMDNDPRIIPIGHFMRKLSIDELPQFFNILKGDMSLVGTRPPTVDEWEQYRPHHRARLCAKPGLTGLWQVSGRSDITDFEDVVKLDLQYIQNWSIELDIRLILKTVYVVLARKGAS